jgi:hypothetical protein
MNSVIHILLLHQYKIETLIDASKVGLEVNVEKSTYMLVSHYQNTLQNQYKK